MLKNLRKSVFLKMFCVYAGIILLFGLAISVYSFISIKNYYVETLTMNLINTGEALKAKVYPMLKGRQFKELDLFVKEMDRKIDTRITVTDNTGKVLADSENDPGAMENHSYRAEIAQALKGQTGKSVRLSATAKKEMLYIALPMENNGRIAGALRLSLFTSRINELIGRLVKKVLNVMLLMIILSTAIALVFARSISAPIKQLAAASQKVAAGNFDTRIYLKNNDEFRELADSFNYMTNEVKSLFAEINSRKEELNSIISSVPAGIIVLDKEGRVLMHNDSFEGIAGIGAINGKFYWEVIRDKKFCEIIKKIQDGNKNISGEMEVNGSSFICTANELPSGREAVVILHDITSLKNVETIKKDLIANVSHELKTPLTAIKGFLESIEGENVQNKHYLEIIRRNVVRIINIVEDLLTLSKLEEDRTGIQLQQVNLPEMINNIQAVFGRKIKEKGLDFVLETGEDFPASIKADPFILEQMFINLIDNSLKYTEKGEIKVSFKKAEGFIRVEVSDTGIGIPEEHLPRVFERFYVVDKSRSRQLGGTGLGLSIVKHIVLLHNGTIEVESKVNRGTKIIINLPV